jgi:hypothetical protein
MFSILFKTTAWRLFRGLQQIGLAEKHERLTGHFLGHVDDERGLPAGIRAR